MSNAIHRRSNSIEEQANPRVVYHSPARDDDTEINRAFEGHEDMGYNVINMTQVEVKRWPDSAKDIDAVYADIDENALNFVDVNDMSEMKSALLCLKGLTIYLTFSFDNAESGTRMMVTDVVGVLI